MRRPAFSSLELLLFVVIIAALTSLSVPLYRSILIRGDLSRSAEQVTQALSRAQSLARNAQEDAAWGFDASHGVIFKGESYDMRDPAFDEVYPMPSTITLSGTLVDFEVSYSKLEGKPSRTGSIVLIDLEGEERTVSILILAEGIPIVMEDKLTICHCQSTTPKTLQIPENAWPAHQEHGDYLGSCIPDKPCAGN